LGHQADDENIADATSLPQEPIPSSLDTDTLKAIAAAQNEYGTRDRGGQRRESSAAETQPTTEAIKPTALKKRPAPKSSVANLKAPSDIKKPPSKKRKIETGSDRGTPSSIRGSPAPSVSSVRAKPTAKGARKNSTSATPRGSSPVNASSPRAASESASEDDGIYCICRKGDNHQWMIACDGGCDDWFHGKCVNISQQDEGLIDKYICPNCSEKLEIVTTWKPMCRRNGCRKPARLKKGAESKYCCDECGLLFMQTQIGRLPGQKQQAPAARGTRGKKAELATTRPKGNMSDSEDDLGPLGGPIRSHELKALALAAPDLDTFRRFGSNRLLTPPPEQPTDADKKMELDNKPVVTPQLDDITINRLEAISKRKDELRQRRLLLKDRERFLGFAKERAAHAAGIAKIKDLCGYDARLSWDEVVFREWRESSDGISAFYNCTLDIADGIEAAPTTNGTSTNGLKPRPQPARTMTSETAATMDGNVEICTRKRCQRHNGWQKLTLHDVRFEEAEVGDEMRKIDAEERSIRQNALGAAQNKAMAAIDGELGTVEVVGDDVEILVPGAVVVDAPVMA